MPTKPRALARGDVVGIVSPSSEIRSFPRRTERALAAMTAAGYVPRMAPSARAALGKGAGTPAERAADLHALFEDDEVRAVICSTGGYSTNRILPLLDFELFARKPKILCGYSDATALLCAVHARADLVTFYGPALLPSFGEFGGPFRFTLDAFANVVEGLAPASLECPAEFTDEYTHWDREDDRPRTLRSATPWVTVTPGVAEGPIAGGNLTTLVRLCGTPYMPSLQGTVLFLEEVGSSPPEVEAHLAQLEQAGHLAEVRGVVFGRTNGFADDATFGLRHVLSALGERYGIPVLADVDFGHTDPRLTLPLGVRCRLQSEHGDHGDHGERTLALLECAVSCEESPRPLA